MTPDAGGKPQRFSIQSRFKSFGYAFSGVGLLLKAEHNAWIHLAATVVVIAVSFALEISVSDWRWIVLAIGLVWSAEAFNTAIEGVCDIISPGFDERIRVAKDVAAGGVLVFALAAALIGGLTLGPYILKMFGFEAETLVDRSRGINGRLEKCPAIAASQHRIYTIQTDSGDCNRWLKRPLPWPPNNCGRRSIR